MTDKIIEILKEGGYDKYGLKEAVTRINSLYSGGVKEMTCPECGGEIQLGLSDEVMEKLKKSKLFPHPTPEISEEKIVKIVAGIDDLKRSIKKSGNSTFHTAMGIRFIDDLLDELKTILSKGVKRPIIEQIVLKVLDGMDGIGGIPGNEDFCNEFDMRLRAAMDVSQPSEISEDSIVSCMVMHSKRHDENTECLQEDKFYRVAKAIIRILNELKGAKPISEESNKCELCGKKISDGFRFCGDRCKDY